MKAAAKRLREEDEKKWTFKRVGEALGVDESTVRKWNLWTDTTNRKSPNSCTPKGSSRQPDARLLDQGLTQKQVAELLGVSRQCVGQGVSRGFLASRFHQVSRHPQTPVYTSLYR
jgi:DNA-directed RNA polymerase specialized sigma subunit